MCNERLNVMQDVGQAVAVGKPEFLAQSVARSLYATDGGVHQRCYFLTAQPHPQIDAELDIVGLEL